MIDDRLLERALAESGIAGAVAHISGPDGVRYHRAFGYADVVTGAAMTPDTAFQIASMTKAVVSASALQLVERGTLSLDAPLGGLLPALADPMVITGFDDDGQALLRPATRAVTLRHLLTHTAGFGYAFVQDGAARWAAANPTAPGSLAGIAMPLLFDPGEQWDYSVATDWVGLAVEAASGMDLGAYLAAHITGPLGMTATGFCTAATMPADSAAVHARIPGGDIARVDIHIGGGEFLSGGGGLTSTAPDYDRFLRMVLNGGEAGGTRILSADSAAMMTANAIGPLRAGYLPTAMPDFASAYDPFPDQHSGWSLGGFLINPQPGPHGRSAGSLSWAGIFNCYYWADPATGIAGIFLSQLMPFADPGALAAFAALERMAYTRG